MKGERGTEEGDEARNSGRLAARPLMSSSASLIMIETPLKKKSND